MSFTTLWLLRRRLRTVAVEDGRAMAETLCGWDTGQPAETEPGLRLAVRSAAYPSYLKG